jgi:hypothetical protein
MILTRIRGGLGNQFFQYACGRYLSCLYNTDLYLDCIRSEDFRPYLLHRYNIDGCALTKPEEDILRFNKFKRFREDETRINKEIWMLPEGLNIYINGYWQSHYYFVRIGDVIKHNLTLKEPINTPQFKEMADKIKNSNSVMMHIRRGDYLGLEDYYVNLPIEYYNQAFTLINSKVKDPQYYIFSDDIEWCKTNITGDNITHVDLHQQGFEDLELMRLCKHFVIANSTLSWWGAWLSDSPDKIVIAPKKWIKNEKEDFRTPSSWIRI